MQFSVADSPIDVLRSSIGVLFVNATENRVHFFSDTQLCRRHARIKQFFN